MNSWPIIRCPSLIPDFEVPELGFNDFVISRVLPFVCRCCFFSQHVLRNQLLIQKTHGNPLLENKAKSVQFWGQNTPKMILFMI